MVKRRQIVGYLIVLLTLALAACTPITVQIAPTPTADTAAAEAPEMAAECEPAVASPPLLRPGALIMSINATIPPVQYIDDEGNLQGMRVELGNEIAKRLCLEPDWVNIQFDAMIPGLDGERWDMINTGLFYTEERAEIMELIPYELQAISISVPAGNPEGISSTEEMAGKIVGVEVGGYEERQIRTIDENQVANGLEPMDIRTFNTFAEAYQALTAGQLDAVVSVDATAKFYQDQGEFERAISGLAGSPASLAFKQTDLAEAVQQVLNELKEDGYYDELFDRWGVAKIDNWENWNGQFEIY